MLRSTRQASPTAATALLVLLAAAGCSQGGSKDLPASEVQLQQNHHVWLLSSVAAFASFPVQPAEVLPLFGQILLNQDSTYTITLSGATGGTDGYALGNDGTFNIFVDRGPSRPRIRYQGAYGLEGDTGLFFFTDRFAGSATGGIGMFMGSEVTATAPTLAQDWHAFSLHVIYAGATALLESRNVGRAVGGSITIDGAGAITGTGSESTLASITWTGTAQGFADGTVSLILDYADPQTTDTRTFMASAGSNVIVGLDDDQTNGENGIVAMVAKRTGTADPMLLEGDYHLGLQTIFVDTARAGTDAATGTLKLNATGGFTITMVNAQGLTFGFSGTYTLADDGALTLDVGNGTETWLGAVDQDYKTVVLLDNFVEPPGVEPPALNFFLGLRAPATTP